MAPQLKITALIAMLGAVASATCGCSQSESERRLEEKRAPVIRALKDPQSAQFRSETLRGLYLCGEINSKNDQGGYVGFKRFISFEKGYAVDGYPTASFFDQARETDQVISEIHQQTELWKELRRQPTADELNKAYFAALWSKHCG